jgi:YEATS domain-containing protein 4
MATASGSGTVSTARVDKQIKIIKPIVYGNTAYALPQKLPNGHTHKWRLYIRPYIHSDDLSKYIRKVQFKLHESYPNPIRVTDLTPFELEETGWGEFEAQVSHFFVDFCIAFLFFRSRYTLPT